MSDTAIPLFNYSRFFTDLDGNEYEVPWNKTEDFLTESRKENRFILPAALYRDDAGQYIVPDGDVPAFTEKHKEAKKITVVNSMNGLTYDVPEDQFSTFKKNTVGDPVFDADRADFKERYDAAMEKWKQQNTPQQGNHPAQEQPPEMSGWQKAGATVANTGKALLRGGFNIPKMYDKAGLFLLGEDLGRALGWGKIKEGMEQMEENDLQYKETGNWLADAFPQMVESLTTAITVGVATGGAGAVATAAGSGGARAAAIQLGKELIKPSALSALYGLSTAHDVKMEALGKGESTRKAYGLGMLAGTTEAVLENMTKVFGLQKITSRIVKGQIFKKVIDVALDFVGEGATEFGQELSTSLFLKLGGIREEDWKTILERSTEAFLLGGGTALLGEGVTGILGKSISGLRAKRYQKMADVARSQGLSGNIGTVREDGTVTFKDGVTVDAEGRVNLEGPVTETQPVEQPAPIEEAKPAMSEAVSGDFLEKLRDGTAQSVDVPVDRIAVNDRIKQFKSDADPETGVTEGYALAGEYQTLPPKPILLMEFTDGHLEVVTGRHRLDLARRTGKVDIPAAVIRESDGWTIGDAKLFDAYDNILDEKGSSEDYVRFFRQSGITHDAAEKKGLLGRPRGRDAFVVAHDAGEDLYAAALENKERFGVTEAAAIATQAPRRMGPYAEGIQRAVMTAAIKSRLSANESAIMAASMLHAYNVRRQAKGLEQLSLFEENDTAIQAMAEESRIVAAKRSQLTNARAAIRNALNKTEKLKLTAEFARQYGITDTDNKAQLQAAVDAIQTDIARWEHYFTDPALSEEVRREAALRLGLDPVAVEVNGEITTQGELRRAEESAAEATAEPITDMLFNPDLPRDPVFNGTTDSGDSLFRAPLLTAAEQDAGFIEYTAAEGVVTVTRAEITGAVSPATLAALREQFGNARVELAPGLQGVPFLQELAVTSTDGKGTGKTITGGKLKIGEVLDTHEKAEAFRESIVYREVDKADLLHPNIKPMDAAKYFIENLLGKTFTTPQGKTFTVNDGHFVRFVCAGIEGQKKGYVEGAKSGQEALQMIHDGRIKAIPGYQSDRASMLPLLPMIIQNPSAILNENDTSPLKQVHVLGFKTTQGKVAILVFRDVGEKRVGPLSFHKNRIGDAFLKKNSLAYSEVSEAGPITANPADGVQSGRGSAGYNSSSDADRVTHSEPIVNPPGDTDILASVKAGGQGYTVIPGIGRVLDAGAYNNQSESGRMEARPAIDSRDPSIVTRFPMTQEAATQLYLSLSKHKLPNVHKAFPGHLADAMGYYSGKTNEVTLLAGIFGIIDQSDLAAIKIDLKEKGFFRYEDPQWAVAMSRAVIKNEKLRSNEAFIKASQDLINHRTQHGGGNTRSLRVMVHELAHLVDYLPEGAIIDRGNLLGHLAALKKHLAASITGQNGEIKNHELVKEAKEIITWWRGTGQFEKYFAKPAEMYAELLGVFLSNPGEMQNRAPQCYQAFDEFLQTHPEADKAYWEIINEVKSNGLDLTVMRQITAPFTAKEQAKLRQLGEETTDRKHHWKEWAIAVFLGRSRPVIRFIERPTKEANANLKLTLATGAITQAEHDAQVARNKQEITQFEYDFKGYMHGDNAARLMFTDVIGRVTPVLENTGLDLVDLDQLLFLRRVIELKGRAVARGLTPADATHQIETLKRNLVAERFVALESAENIFYSVYEQNVIDDSNVQYMMGPKMMALMRANKHYITMKHRVSPEEVAEIQRARKEWSDAHPNVPNPLDIAYASATGINEGKRTPGMPKTLTGSFKDVESPIVATLKTAFAIKQAARKNALIAETARLLEKSELSEVMVGRVHNGKIIPNNTQKWGNKPVEMLNNARFGTLTYLEHGQEMAVILPRVIQEVYERKPWNFGIFGATNRWLASFMTVNNFAFLFPALERDIAAATQLLPGLRRSPLAMLPIYLQAIPGGKVTTQGLFFSWVVKHIPMSVMRRAPIWFFNEHTFEYWTPLAWKATQMIQKAGYMESELLRAKTLEAQGKTEAARDIREAAEFARMAQEDGIFITSNQVIRGDYGKGSMEILGRQLGVHLKGNDKALTPHQRALKKAVGLAERYQSISEGNEMLVKLTGFIYLHKVNPKNQTRQEIALMTMTRSGTPDIAERGFHATTIEMMFGNFWNVRKEGVLRTIQAAKEDPKDFWPKQIIYTAIPRLVAIFLSEGILMEIIKWRFDDDEEKIRQSRIGAFYEYLGWYKKAMANVSTYLKRTYRCIPVWDYGNGSTRVITIPIADESRVVDMTIQALFNQALLKSGRAVADPDLRLRDLVSEMSRQILPDFEGSSPAVSLFRTWVQPFLIGSNPYDTYRGDNVFTRDEMDTRWTTPHAAKKAFKRTWNMSPLQTVIRLREDDREGDILEGAARDHQRLLSLPVIGPAIGRWSRISSSGVQQTVFAYERLDNEQDAVIRLHVKEDLVESIRAGERIQRSHDRSHAEGEYGRKYNELYDAAERRYDADRHFGDIQLLKKAQSLSDARIRSLAEDYLQGIGL